MKSCLRRNHFLFRLAWGILAFLNVSIHHLRSWNESAQLSGLVGTQYLQNIRRLASFVTRAGHFRYFLNFFNNKKLFFGISLLVNNIFLHQSYLEAHSHSNYLDKKCEKWFFICEKIQKYRKCPALFVS